MNFLILISQPNRLQLRVAGPLARYNVHKKTTGCWIPYILYKLYEVYVDPVINYASGVWGLKNFSFPESTQNRAIRMSLGVLRFAPNKAINGDISQVDDQK